MSAFDSLPCVKREAVLGASGALYVFSLMMPAMYFEKEAPLSGIAVLAQGWCGVFMLNPAWLANPFYIASAIQLARRRYARASQFSGAAFVCALCSLFTTKWYFNEADATPISSFGIAFYVWLFAQLVLLLGSVRLRRDAVDVQTGK